MVEERPRRRGRKKVARGRPKKTPAKRPRAKQPPVLKEEQLPGLLEADIPEQPPVAEEAAVEQERPAVAEEAAVEEMQPAIAKEAAISAETAEEAVLAAEPKPARKPSQPSTLPITLMTRPQFRQRVIRSVVRRLR